MTDTLELPPPGKATYADLEALPERYVGEIIAGTLYAQARPASPYLRAATQLGVLLGQAFGRRFRKRRWPARWLVAAVPA